MQRIEELDREILCLQKSAMHSKMSKLQEMVSLKEEMHEESLENSIKKFLIQVEWNDNVLISHCR